jgi:hypothetical protein
MPTPAPRVLCGFQKEVLTPFSDKICLVKRLKELLDKAEKGGSRERKTSDPGGARVFVAATYAVRAVQGQRGPRLGRIGAGSHFGVNQPFLCTKKYGCSPIQDIFRKERHRSTLRYSMKRRKLRIALSLRPLTDTSEPILSNTEAKTGLGSQKATYLGWD